MIRVVAQPLSRVSLPDLKSEFILDEKEKIWQIERGTGINLLLSNFCFASKLDFILTKTLNQRVAHDQHDQHKGKSRGDGSGLQGSQAPGDQ